MLRHVGLQQFRECCVRAVCDCEEIDSGLKLATPLVGLIRVSTVLFHVGVSVVYIVYRLGENDCRN